MQKLHKPRLTRLLAAIAYSLVVGVGLNFTGHAAAAACTAPSTDYGTATVTVSVPAAATYRVWTRINAPDNSNNTYLLQVDSSTCYNVGGGSYATNSWTWIAHQNGSTSSKIDTALSQGNHTLKLIGNKPGVKIDRLIFSSDLNCVPTSSTGTECNTPSDTTAPSTRITSPAANASVSGTTTVTATASDSVGVTKVELYVNSTLIGTDTSSPYSFSWNTTTSPNEAQQLTVKAYDAAGNIGTDSFKVTVANGDKTAPSVPSGLTASAPVYNKVNLSWKASTDSVGVKGYNIIRDGVPVATTSSTSYTDTPVSANTSYVYQISAFDAAGNTSASSSKVTVKTPNVADSQAPTAPEQVKATAASSTQIDLTWSESNDNIGVTAYDVYRATTGDATKVATVSTTSYGDTGLNPGTNYTYYVIAKDGAGNESDPSGKSTATTEAIRKKSALTGTVTNSATHKGIRHAAVIITIGTNKHIIQANRDGVYTIRNLEIGRYNVSYRANGYYSRSFSIKLTSSSVLVKDVALQKR